MAKAKPKAKPAPRAKKAVKKTVRSTVKVTESESNGEDKFAGLQQVAAEYLGLVNIMNPDNCRDMKERHDVLFERLKTAAKSVLGKH